MDITLLKKALDRKDIVFAKEDKYRPHTVIFGNNAKRDQISFDKLVCKIKEWAKKHGFILYSCINEKKYEVAVIPLKYNEKDIKRAARFKGTSEFNAIKKAGIYMLKNKDKK